MFVCVSLRVSFELVCMLRGLEVGSVPERTLVLIHAVSDVSPRSSPITRQQRPEKAQDFAPQPRQESKRKTASHKPQIVSECCEVVHAPVSLRDLNIGNDQPERLSNPSRCVMFASFRPGSMPEPYLLCPMTISQQNS